MEEISTDHIGLKEKRLAGNRNWRECKKGTSGKNATLSEMSLLIRKTGTQKDIELRLFARSIRSFVSRYVQAVEFTGETGLMR